MELAGRLRRILEGLSIRLPDGRTLRKTASFGVASLQKNGSAEQIVNEADRMLYRAKAMGRNTVMPKLDVCGEEKTAGMLGCWDARTLGGIEA
jgi:diguanylate cyclase (GGDEF)-like protein